MTGAPVRSTLRYTIGAAVAKTGLWTVHVARTFGAVGFARTVAVKRLDDRFRRHPQAITALATEACLVARVRHINVLQVLDVIHAGDELMLEIDYVDGVPLSALTSMAQTGGQPPPSIAVAIVADVLRGLDAAHHATAPSGGPLGIVHRAVSPSTILVGADGRTRIGHFGDELGRDDAYQAPEQRRAGHVTTRSDIYAVGMVLRELLTGRRFSASDGRAPPPSALTALVLRALALDPWERFRSAGEMAIAIEDAHPPALARQVGAWVEAHAGADLAEQRAAVADLEARGAVRLHARAS
jgi:serine/threonine-protein kinase